MTDRYPPHRRLQQSLAHLHAELAAVHQLDPTSRRLLREVLADIESVLQESPERREAGAGAAVGEADRGKSPASGAWLPRLEGLAVELEADHPVLAGSLRQLMDLLGRAGL